MAINEAYTVTEIVEQRRQEPAGGNGDDQSRYCSAGNGDEKLFSFDDAINMEGNGCYAISLLAILSLTTLSMSMDMFGFSVVVTGASCDLDLDLKQTRTLLSMCFIGPIIMSYPWGYISDTQGRRKVLLISMGVSFLLSTISAFSPSSSVMAVFKLLSTSFSAQSATYTLLGESCPTRVRDGYMLIMTSVLEFMLSVYIAIAYGIINLDFSYDLIFITFTPWRLLAVVLASFLGFAAVGVHMIYESPKFLLNAGREQEAVDVLKGIWTWNGGKNENFQVKRLYLSEAGNLAPNDGPLWKSLWAQVVPLFKTPLLWRSLQLYFLTAVIYGTNSSYTTWFPVLVQKFFKGYGSSSDGHGLCALIISSYNNDAQHGSCSSKVEVNVVWSSLAQSLVLVAIQLGLAKIAHRKRTMMIIVLLTSCVCGLGAILTPHAMASLVLFFGQLTNGLMIGVIYSYYVDLYPTSYRGMAACLGTMVARTGSLAGVNVFGAFVMTHCSNTFYVCSGLMICGILVTLLLPPDKTRK